MAKGIDLCKCIICCDPHVKRINCRIFAVEDLRVDKQKVRNIFGDRCFNEEKILYICNRCLKDIKNVGKKETKLMEEKSFMCTCCHETFDQRKRVIVFERKKYDFTHHVVKEALSESVRRRNQRTEFICKNCHGLLNKNTKHIEPQMPGNAKCLDTSWTNKEKNFRVFNFPAILMRFQKCKTYEELEKEVDECQVKGHVKVAFNRILATDKIDRLAQSLVPADCPGGADVWPVAATGNGSCFFNTLSRLCFGNEKHAIEMRVRIIIEAVRNKQRYLDNKYLSRGYVSPHAQNCHIAEMYMTYGSDNLQGFKDRETFYKEEVMELRGTYAYSGVWQFHQAASVLDKPIKGVYPECAISYLRKDMNRIFLPPQVKQNDSSVTIMWTKTQPHLAACNHFVPLVRYVLFYMSNM